MAEHRTGPLIYIAGERRSGKDTAAQALYAIYPQMQVLQMTSPLYDIGQTYFHMAGKDRGLLQRLGDAFRSIEKDFLARYVDERAGDGPAVCPDVRMPQEGAYLRALGWIGLRIRRPEEARLAAVRAAGEETEGPQAQHATETQIDRIPVDAIIDNDGSIADLQRKVRAVLWELTAPKDVAVYSHFVSPEYDGRGNITKIHHPDIEAREAIAAATRLREELERKAAERARRQALRRAQRQAKAG